MKMYNFFAFGTLLLVALFSSAFVQPEKPITENSENPYQDFALFLSKFEKTALPFQIGLDDLGKYNLSTTPTLRSSRGKQKNKRVVRSDFSKYLPDLAMGKVSRSGSPEILPVARFYPNENTVAVIYKVTHRFWGDQMANFKMSLFDLKGKAVDSGDSKLMQRGTFQLAQGNRNTSQSFSIDKMGWIQKNTYTNIWKKDIQQFGLQDNEIVDYQLVSTDAFQINTKGLVEVVKSYATDAKASLD